LGKSTGYGIQNRQQRGPVRDGWYTVNLVNLIVETCHSEPEARNLVVTLRLLVALLFRMAGYKNQVG